MRRKWQVGSAAAVLIVAGAAYLVRDQIALARIGTGFAAKQTCSCLYVSRRSLPSCMTDFDSATAQWFTWHVDDGRSVTVSALLGLFSLGLMIRDRALAHPSLAARIAPRIKPLLEWTTELFCHCVQPLCSVPELSAGGGLNVLPAFRASTPRLAH